VSVQSCNPSPMRSNLVWLDAFLQCVNTSTSQRVWSDEAGRKADLLHPGQHAPPSLPEGRGTGAGSTKRNSQAANAIKRFLHSTQATTAIVELHVVAPVRNAAAIGKAVGFPVVGFVVVLENSTARHTIRRHGSAAAEAKRGQIAVTEDDLVLMPQLLCEFDLVEPAETTKQGTVQARFRKRIGAVEYEVFAEVRRAAKQLAFKTMLKRRAREGASS